jgi:putative endonuclease
MLVLQMIYDEDDEHKHKVIKGFTQKYNVNKLIYFETFQDIRLAIIREKKNKLVRLKNPEWRDLSFDFE